MSLHHGVESNQPRAGDAQWVDLQLSDTARRNDTADESDDSSEFVAIDDGATIASNEVALDCR